MIFGLKWRTFGHLFSFLCVYQVCEERPKYLGSQMCWKGFLVSDFNVTVMVEEW